MARSLTEPGDQQVLLSYEDLRALRIPWTRRTVLKKGRQGTFSLKAPGSRVRLSAGMLAAGRTWHNGPTVSRSGQSAGRGAPALHAVAASAVDHTKSEQGGAEEGQRGGFGDRCRRDAAAKG
jgi:hypothetical protein